MQPFEGTQFNTEDLVGVPIRLWAAATLLCADPVWAPPSYSQFAGFPAGKLQVFPVDLNRTCETLGLISSKPVVWRRPASGGRGLQGGARGGPLGGQGEHVAVRGRGRARGAGRRNLTQVALMRLTKAQSESTFEAVLGSLVQA